MKKYIGTKVVSAIPAIRKGGKVYLPTDEIPKTMESVEEGGKVYLPTDEIPKTIE